MKKLNTVNIVSEEIWKWPVNVNEYDRRTELTSDEFEALDLLIARFNRRSNVWPPQFISTLKRLTQPINDVLGVTAPFRHYFARTLLLREMHARKSTFWAWSEDEWIEIMNNSTYLEEKRSHYRQHIICFAYLMCGFMKFSAFNKWYPYLVARKIFSTSLIEDNIRTISEGLISVGYEKTGTGNYLRPAISMIMIFNRSPYLHDLTTAKLAEMRQKYFPEFQKSNIYRISRALVEKRIITNSISKVEKLVPSQMEVTPEDVPSEWHAWCQRWFNTSTMEFITRRVHFHALVKVGRWLKLHHPDAANPADWDRQLAAELVAAINTWKVGDYAVGPQSVPRIGKPLSASTKGSHLAAVRSFFRDLQEWNLIPRRFNAIATFAIPKHILSQLGPNPRVIDSHIWAKIMHAGLNLEQADLPSPGLETVRTMHATTYPLELVQALTVVWLFTGLRSNEITRLPVGCIRWLSDDIADTNAEAPGPKPAVCLLDVPVHKTGNAFTKPVDVQVGKAIERWERIRQSQPAALDHKTGEKVIYLFSYRGIQVSKDYINATIIPMLCRKAGVPEEDARGRITSHRARSTIATQLYNAPEGLSLYELQEWLGHRSLSSTQHYAKIYPTKLAKSYKDADYFSRNLRTIDVLIDQDAIMGGDASKGLPWKYYDLGHGYCTHVFFEQCEHRMACAKCEYYRPKSAFLQLLLEKKEHLLHMRQSIQLTDIELAAVDGDLEAASRLIEKLTNVPTPAGPTPQELNG